jgi:chemotaxis protein methyltransferase CheR
MALASKSDVSPPNGLTRNQFDRVRTLAHRTFGLDLRPGKEALVAARLAKRVREGQFHDIEEYLEVLSSDSTGQELVRLIDALTTNHTSFLRESQHFDFLRNTILPRISGRGRIEVWSAACSTGEEPYSILFTLLEALGVEAASRISIRASDISTRALAVAGRGVYPVERFAGVPSSWLSKFLQKGTGTQSGFYRVKPQLASAIHWERRNLIEPIDQAGEYPVIFCRNVMIYFDPETQEKLVRALSDRLEPGGYLLIGHSEGLMRIRHSLRYVAPATYQRPARS